MGEKLFNSKPMPKNKITEWSDNPQKLVDFINANTGKCKLHNSEYSHSRCATIDAATLLYGKHVKLRVGSRDIPIFEGIDTIELPQGYNE